MPTISLVTLLLALLKIETLYITQADLYKTIVSSPCKRILTKDGHIGCSGLPSGNKGKIIRLKDAAELVTFLKSDPLEPVIVAIEAKLFSNDNVAKLTANKFVSSIFVLHNEGVIYEKNSDNVAPFASSLPSIKNALEAYDWNKNGDGLRFEDIKIPVQFINNDDETNKLLFSRRKEANAVYVKLKMESLAKKNTKDCLKKAECVPLGASTVFASFNNVTEDQEYIIISASITSRTFFELSTASLSSSLSGLSVMLAIAKRLGKIDGIKEKLNSENLNIIFLAFGAQQHGLLGSELFAFHMGCTFKQAKNNECEVKTFDTVIAKLAGKINVKKIKLFIDLGQLSFIKEDNAETDTLYYYPTSQFVSKPALLLSFTNAATAAGAKMEKPTVNGNGKKVPPSPSWSFINRFEVPLIHLADHDGAFINPNFGTESDVLMTPHRVAQVATVALKAVADIAKIDPKLVGEIGANEIIKITNCFKLDSCSSLYLEPNYTSFVNSDKSYYKAKERDLSMKSDRLAEKKIFTILSTAIDAGESVNMDCLQSKCDNSTVLLVPAYSKGFSFDEKDKKWALIPFGTGERSDLLARSDFSFENVVAYIKETRKMKIIVASVGGGLFVVTLAVSCLLRRLCVSKYKVL